MSLTIPYHDVDRFIADPLSDPLLRLLAEEDEWGEIEATIERELAFEHVKPKCEYNFD